MKLPLGKRARVGALLGLLAIGALAGCGSAASPTQAVVGNWESPARNVAYTFAADGTGIEHNYHPQSVYGRASDAQNDFTYTVTSAGTIVMDFGLIKATATISGDTLSLSDGSKRYERAAVLATPTPDARKFVLP